MYVQVNKVMVPSSTGQASYLLFIHEFTHSEIKVHLLMFNGESKYVIFYFDY